jgi:hypothetical protein
MDEAQTLNFSYSFDDENYTSLALTRESGDSIADFSFHLDLSDQDDGDVRVYVKANDGYSDSNVASVVIEKDTRPILELDSNNSESCNNQSTVYL